MKKILKNILCVGLLGFSVASFADNYGSYNDFDGLTCSGKQKVLENKIERAKNYDNKYQVRGLEKALDDVLTYCQNDNLEQKYLDNIQKKKLEVLDRQDDLDQAIIDGKTSKIKKLERKLKNDKDELNDAEKKLDLFRQALKLENK